MHKSGDNKLLSSVAIDFKPTLTVSNNVATHNEPLSLKRVISISVRSFQMVAMYGDN